MLGWCAGFCFFLLFFHVAFLWDPEPGHSSGIYLSLKMKTVHSFETFGSGYPLVHHHIPEERSPQLLTAKTSELTKTLFVLCDVNTHSVKSFATLAAILHL